LKINALLRELIAGRSGAFLKSPEGTSFNTFCSTPFTAYIGLRLNVGARRVSTFTVLARILRQQNDGHRLAAIRAGLVPLVST
jgi:hypothetical protein